jgi:hypothetical protein
VRTETVTAIRLQASAGGCLCGAVRFVVRGTVTESGFCHCRTCQKQSGAPVVAWFAIAPSGFRYISGTPKKFQAFPPDFHIWHESRITWFETSDTLPRHAKGKS